MLDDSTKKLDCHVSVITPENIQFEYALAGPFQRLPAFILDLVIRCVVLAVIVVAGTFFSVWLPLGSAMVSIAALIGFFLLSWFYGIFFESRFNGRTPGKMLFKLRTISTDGRPINLSQAALRNTIRLADMAAFLSLQLFSEDMPQAYVIPTFSFGLITMILSPRMQRLGDLAAGTMVVSERIHSSPWNIKPDDVRAYGLAELIPATFVVSSSMAQTLGLYMENRSRLGAARRNEVAKHLAKPLISEFELLADTGPDLLLCALYVRTFQSEQQQEEGRQQLRELNRPVRRPGQSGMPGSGKSGTPGKGNG